ncbi:MAG TPA: VOC family protein [Pseudonocardiaceae bacterium]|nr:VOC family protein [Pseudonocardiaceae bacterium]
MLPASLRTSTSQPAASAASRCRTDKALAGARRGDNGRMAARFKDICLDAADHHALADWWCTALGYRRRDDDREPGDPVPIVDPGGHGPLIWVNPVPEPKAVKNRMHIDVYGSTDELVALGATLQRAKDGVERVWDVLTDPEGNEFCVFVPE